MIKKLFALHDPDLQPKVQFFPGLPDDGMALNIDACILLAKDGETPKARRVYRLYRKYLRRLGHETGHGLTGASLRSEAFFRAMEETGVSFEMTRLPSV